MTTISGSASRAIGRSLSKIRLYSSTSVRPSYIAEQAALQHHAAETTNLWRKISYYVCVPAITVCVAWVYNAELEHKQHLDHLRAEHAGHLPEVPAFEYMNRRIKPFPWGMNSLFFNPHSNKDLSV